MTAIEWLELAKSRVESLELTEWPGNERIKDQVIKYINEAVVLIKSAPMSKPMWPHSK